MIQQKQQSKNFESITVLQRKTYGCLAKIFCCRCIHCCQDFDFSLLTSEHRKEVFHKMIKKYIRKLRDNKALSVIMDPFFILVALLLGEDSQIYAELMSIITNQSQPIIFSKQDLQFYIPELCTYLVFHQELKNIELQKLLVRACKVDIHFSLKYYFYMKSLQIVRNGDQLRKYETVSQYNNKFRNMINHYYLINKNQREFATLINPQPKTEDDSSLVLEKANSGRQQTEIQDKQNLRNTIGPLHHSSIVSKTKQFKADQTMQKEKKSISSSIVSNVAQSQQFLQDKIKTNKLRFLKQTNIYESFIAKQVDFPKGIFQSTVNFFSDLIELSKLLVSSNNRKQQLKSQLQKINERLPATVYIPFTKDCYQNLNIISILYDQSRVFNTKERAPFYVCFQSFYNSSYNEGMSRDKKIRSTSFAKRQFMKKSRILEDQQKNVEEIRQSQISIKVQGQKKQHQQKNQKGQNNLKQKKTKSKGWSKFFNLNKIKRTIIHQKNDTQNQDEQIQEDQHQTKSQSHQSEQITHQLVHSKVQQKQDSIDKYFGQTQEEQFTRISQVSPYSDLPGYKLIHVIIKSYDDLRQESFAMQLLQQFDKIFKLQNLPVKLYPYQVLPLSHEAGIMECVRDAVTIDELRKKGGTLASILNSKSKKKNFINSLVGYSLITYFLQVKDRHNGNIMIKSDGSIFHIDYGFFMTNMPGKGVQLQKNLPFKLTNQYVQALQGVKSKTFQDFRLLFYKAFNACRKHQHRIIILTKLMYSSYGTTMPCFIKGDEAIQKLQERFNPPGISNDAEISVYCQNLINSSIDNWRSRWYDKWQYYVQGIFY